MSDSESVESACSPLPGGYTRDDAIAGLRETLDDAEAHQRLSDPSFVRWPDMHALLDHIEQHGFPAPENKEIDRKSS